MICKGFLTLVAAACLSSLVFAKNEPKASDAELAAITARGRLLAGFDNAAWHATDAVMATKPKEGLVKRYIRGKPMRVGSWRSVTSTRRKISS